MNNVKQNRKKDNTKVVVPETVITEEQQKKKFIKSLAQIIVGITLRDAEERRKEKEKGIK